MRAPTRAECELVGRSTTYADAPWPSSLPGDYGDCVTEFPESSEGRAGSARRGFKLLAICDGAGTFKTERDAKARRDLVAGEIAHGRNPADLLAGLASVHSASVSFETWGDRFVASRIDLAENTRKMYGSHLKRIGETFGSRDPHSITAADVAEWVAAQAEKRKPATVAQYLDVFKVLMDYSGVEPNSRVTHG